jgi:hypothetical protein
MSIKSRKKHPVIKVKGTARYPWLNNPNKKWKEEFGEYTCDLVVDKDQAEMLKNTLRPLYEEELQAVQQQHEGKKIMQRDIPINEDEDGIIVKTKVDAGGRYNDEVYKTTVALYDSKLAPLPEDVIVYGGSKIVLAVRPKFYYVPAIGFGVKLEPVGAQVLELAESGMNSKSADALGFTSEEGYVANGGETLDQAFDAEEDNSEEITANF